MKLFYCPNCEDVVKMTKEVRHCECGSASGFYQDDLNAIINQNAIPIGFSNRSFIDALVCRPEKGQGKEFSAFVIPEKCNTVKVWKS